MLISLQLRVSMGGVLLVHSKASALCIAVDLSDLLTLKFFLCRLCDDNALVRQLEFCLKGFDNLLSAVGKSLAISEKLSLQSFASL